MGVIDREEINGYTKEQVEEAIEQLQTATGEARDAILAQLGSGGSSVIKSIQRGVITVTAGSSNRTGTATINAVNVNKAMLLFLGCTNDGEAEQNDDFKYAHVKLTNSTTVTAERISGHSRITVYVSYEVIEFN